MKSILSFTHIEAKQFLLSQESYVNFDLPKYFTFENLLHKLDKELAGKRVNEYWGSKKIEEKHKTLRPSQFEDVNYKFLNNKDGRFAWRPFQLIHPGIYVSLVNEITEEKNWQIILERFIFFKNNSIVDCVSISNKPNSKENTRTASIKRWWEEIEQRSIKLSLNFEYILHTDIADCYGSLYTHSIVWALHNKDAAKAEIGSKNLLGTFIDQHLQWMSFGQTNGIPQGSTLMDFLAELVLGYADLLLTERLKESGIKDFKIIRYRDDYRIFTNNPLEGELIIKNLSELLINLGMRLNAGKTIASNHVVRDSIKTDKLFWIVNKKVPTNIQQRLLVIHHLSYQHPNSGALTKALTNFYKFIEDKENVSSRVSVLISIVVDIAYRNPRTYPISAAIISKFLSFYKREKTKLNILSSIHKRFQRLPNTGHLQLWLQRISLKINPKEIFTEPLCQKLNDSNHQIWNSDWLSPKLKSLIEKYPIVDKKIIEDLDVIINRKEVDLFANDY